MPETTPLIKAALNLRVGAGFDVYLVNTGIREYLVSMVIFLIPRFMRVYSFLGSCF